MSMPINLSPEMEGFVKGKVETGFYGNATEVVRDAPRRMQAEDARVHAWKMAAKFTDDELDRGDGAGYLPAGQEATVARSPSRRIVTICSSVNRLSLMGSSRIGSHLPRNYWSEETGQVSSASSNWGCSNEQIFQVLLGRSCNMVFLACTRGWRESIFVSFLPLWCIASANFEL